MNERNESQAPTPAAPMTGEAMIRQLEHAQASEHAEAVRVMMALAEATRGEGGRALLVGGSVRDQILGHIPKDLDIEVYGLSAEKVEELVHRFGKTRAVGKAFGVLKLFFGQGVDLDVSLPRVDSKIGEGHRGFAVKTDPHMSIENAARRRDFTMNAMAADPLTGELFDPFGGQGDLKDRLLRVTDTERFQDDPLRVLRAMQFIGRFELTIDQQSEDLMRSMSSTLQELPKDRLEKEWKKLLLKSRRPSLGLRAAMELKIFEALHPQFLPLPQTPQEPEWHPEGDVWTHTMMAIDRAAEIIRREKCDPQTAWVVMVATLCHDLGKATTTFFKDGRWRSHEHDQAGIAPTRDFCNQLGCDHATRDKVEKIVAEHLTPSMLYRAEKQKGQKIGDGAIDGLARRLHPATIQELVWVAEADHTGRGTPPAEHAETLLSFQTFEAGAWLLERAKKRQIEKSKPAPVLQGRDLLDCGFRAGPIFGEIIDLAQRLREEKNFTREEFLEHIRSASDAQDAKHRLENLLK